MTPAAQRGLLATLGIFLGLFLVLWGMQKLLVKSTPGSIGSTLSSNTRGCVGLYTLAEGLSMAPERRYTPFVERIPKDVAQVWIIAPAELLQPDEGKNLAEWVDGGGTLILASKQFPEFQVPMTSMGAPGFLTAGGAPLETMFGPGGTISKVEIPPAEEDILESPEAILGASLQVPEALVAKAEAAPATPNDPNDPLAQGIATLPAMPSPFDGKWQLSVVELGSLSDTLRPMKSVWTTDFGTVLARRPVGRGELIVLTQPEWVSNAFLRADAPLELSARLLEARTRDGRTLFSEFHHGRKGSLRSWRDLAKVGWGQAILWCGGVLLLGFVSAGWRFIAIPPLPPPRPPDPSEYVEALGRLYHRSGARDNVHYNLAAFYRRLSTTPAAAAPGRPASLDVQRRARAIADRLGKLSSGTSTTKELLDVLRTPR